MITKESLTAHLEAIIAFLQVRVGSRVVQIKSEQIIYHFGHGKEFLTAEEFADLVTNPRNVP